MSFVFSLSIQRTFCSFLYVNFDSFGARHIRSLIISNGTIFNKVEIGSMIFMNIKVTSIVEDLKVCLSRIQKYRLHLIAIS